MSLQRARFRGDCSTHEFQEVLKRLKHDGCNLLVTGAVSEDVTVQATQTLLGAPDAERKRVIALADPSAESAYERLPPGVESDDPDVWIIDQDACQRSVPKAAESATASLPSEGTDRSALGRLREEVVVAIDFFADADGGLDPSELRLSVSSLGRMAHEHDPDRIARFVRSVSAMVKGVHGMAHYHLPRPDDDEVVEQLGPLFDARIELRKRDGLPTEQRWHVPQHDQTTEWVRL
ncbi:hypothetical protein M0R88_17290 [Halorussus gelatinilyticus]|uniref:Uncharacterized protein n=1 Tax=Halorussus gelatinilyticus TaxID=2937524 RepID=A0A8U0IGN6_9EURY|nr:hypothetical protein [Halorussus gelatinilyticus]UPW00250.1 hypothetical protein M0R88_17290 [Halorussus gelatinilyticus]